MTIVWTSKLTLAALALTLSGLSTAQAQQAKLERSPGGLAFAHAFMPSEPIQTITFGWRDGTAFAIPGKEAIPALAPQLMMQGPKGSVFSELTEDLSDLRASIRMQGTTDFVFGSISAPADKFAAAAEILRKTLIDPALPPAKMTEFQKGFAERARQAAQNPSSIASRTLLQTIYGESAYSRFHIAEASIFANVSIEDVENWRKSVLTRDNIILVVTGPQSVETVGLSIDGIFGALPASGERVRATPPSYRQLGKLVVIEREAPQTIIYAGAPGKFAAIPGRVGPSIAVMLLGGGPQSRLFRAIRETLGASYGASAGLLSAEDRQRHLLISTAVSHDKAKEAIAAVRSEYARLLADGATEEEISAPRSNIASSFTEQIRRGPGAASALWQVLASGGSIELYNSILDKVLATTAADVNDALRNAFPKAPLTIVVLAPKAEGLGADCVIKGPEELARCQ